MKSLAFTLLALAGAAQAGPIDEIVGRISDQRIEANIRKLAAFGTRNSLSAIQSSTRGIGAARRWIKSRRCSRCGSGRLQVAFDEHLHRIGRARAQSPRRS